jgi:hypothetical protein
MLPKRFSRKGCLPVVAVFAFLVGCDASEEAKPPPTTSGNMSTPPPKIVGTPLPVELTGPQPDVMDFDVMDKTEPTADIDAPLLDRVISQIRHETLLMASVSGKITASCEGGRIRTKTKAVTHCTTTYNGVALHWSIVGSPSLSVPNATEYSYEPDKILLTSKIIYHNFFVYDHHSKEDRERCQKIPDIVLVEKPDPTEETDTGYRCQFLGLEQKGERAWTGMRLFVDSGGKLIWRCESGGWPCKP